MEMVVKLLFESKPYLSSAVIPLLNQDLPYNKIFKINNYDYTLIHLAALRDPLVLKKMLDFEPNLNQFIDIPPGINNPCSSVFVTPLMLAILSGKIENVYLLIDAGADVNQYCITSGHTATSLAICCQNWKLAEDLLERGGRYELQERKGNFSILERITQLKTASFSLKNKIFETNAFPALSELYSLREYQEFSWRILPNRLFRNLQSNCSLEEALEIKQKRLLKIVKKKAFFNNHINFSFLSLFFILKDLGLNYDLFCNFLEKLQITNYYSWNEGEIDYLQNSIKYLREVYSDRQIIRILENSYQANENDLNLLNGFWQDVFFMFFRLEQENKQIKRYIPKKPKSLVHVHDFLGVNMVKENQPNFLLNQQDLHVLSGKIFQDFKIVVPQSNHDLVEVGVKLHICVGNGVYSRKILDRTSEIFLLINSKKIYCIEIDAYNKEILDAKTYYNDPMSDELKLSLQSFLNYQLWWPGREGN